jgi:hypothetical protein
VQRHVIEIAEPLPREDERDQTEWDGDRPVSGNHIVDLGNASPDESDADHPDRENAKGTQQDFQPVAAHKFTPSDPGRRSPAGSGQAITT